MKTLAIIVLLITASFACFSQQLLLKPFIGLSSLPHNDDPICTIPVYTGNFDQSGLKSGDTIPDFTLYTADGVLMNVRTELEKGKPILLVAGSYTCPVYRNQMNGLNQIVQKYRDKVSVYIIYVVEAHPIVDPSPYSGKEWITSQNQQENVLYRQPATYGERKLVLAEMMGRMTIDAPILLDGPCNEWWSVFGPAPNNAYLIDKSGIVASKHGWFNRAPQSMSDDIDRLLGNGTGTGNSGFGRFTFAVDGSASVSGLAGNILTAFATLTNPTAKPVRIFAQRQETRKPSGWATAMCIDVCLSQEVDTLTFYVMPGQSQKFIMYFYSSPAGGDTAVARIRFTNLDSTANQVTQSFRGISDEVVSSVDVIPNGHSLSVYPNPATVSGTLRIDSPEPLTDFVLFDALGRTVWTTGIPNNKSVTLPGYVDRGLYFFRVSEASRMYSGKLLIR